MNFWDQLTGRAFMADLSSAPRRKPRVIRAARWSNYRGYDPGQGTRPRCRACGCDKYLRRDQAFACCPEHEKVVRSQLESLLRAVKVDP